MSGALARGKQLIKVAVILVLASCISAQEAKPLRDFSEPDPPKAAEPAQPVTPPAAPSKPPGPSPHQQRHPSPPGLHPRLSPAKNPRCARSPSALRQSCISALRALPSIA